ncbi:MAG: DUF2341 domain-containing protein [Bacteroidales bacterium]
MKRKSRTLIRILSMVLLLTAAVNSQILAQGPGAAWQYYRVVSLSPVTPSANLQVEINLAAGQYTNMNADGSDLRFYDDANTPCNYWIEVWNTSGTSTIWVKVPTSGATALVMYYGNAGASAASSGDNTFDFFDDFNTALTGKWTYSGSVTQSGTNVTLSRTGGVDASISNTNAFTPSAQSFLLETKHYEVGYNRNRFYATTSTNGGSPIAVGDYGYFSTLGTAQTAAQVFWGSFPGSTSVNNNTNYLTQWRITDGSTYNWYTYNYATGVAVTNGSRTTTYGSNIRYISISITEVNACSSVIDWIRVRKYTATEPTATVGSQTANTEPSTPSTYTSSGYFIVPDGVSSVKVECWGGGGRGGNTAGDGASGGGGGGAYSESEPTVSSGGVYVITVGNGSSSTAPGGDSWFSPNTLGNAVVLAKGGNSVDVNTNGASGGDEGSGIGTNKNSGGNGADAYFGSGTDYGGGGGSSAGTTEDGYYRNLTTVTNTGGTAPAGGGDGGDGRYSTDGSGSIGSPPGGGGGGALRNGGTNYSGGNGAQGQITITCIPPAAPTVSTPVTYCLNATAVPLTATGINLLWYTTSSGGTGSTTAPTPSTSSAGTTSYWVSQTAWCEGPRARIDVLVEQVVATVSGQTNPLCNAASDGTLSVSASGGTGPYSFSKDNGANWLTPGTNPYTFTGLSANTPYRIKVKDSLGCESR